MRPLRLYLKNFMNHKLSEIDCTQFSSVLIIGKNYKNDKISNGVGKTTLFNAIEYVLFNESHSTTLDKVVMDGKKKCIVEYDFQLNNEIYRIYRHRTNTGSPDVRLYKKLPTGEFESISERTPSETDAKIRGLIKISHKAFTYSVLFRQADLTGISTVKEPSKRKEILKEPLNLCVYTKLEELAAKKTKPLKKEIDRLEGSISVIGNPIEDISKSELELSNILTKITNNEQLIKETNASLETKRNFLEELKSSLSMEDSDIYKKISEQENSLKKLRESSSGYELKLKNITTIISNKLKELKTSENNTQEFNKKLTQLSLNKTTDIEELQAVYKRVCADEVRGSGLIAGITAQIKFIKKTIPDTDQCPACQQSITKEYRYTLENETAQKLAIQQDQLNSLEDALTKCQRKKKRLDDEIKTARTLQQDILKLETQINASNNDQVSKREEIDRLTIEQNELNKKIQENSSGILENSKHLDVLRESSTKSSVPVLNNQILLLSKEIDELKENNSLYNQRASSLSSMKGGLEERITNRKADQVKLEILKSSLVTTKSELKIRQMVVDSFHSIPSFIIQTVLDDLQFETNKAVKELRPELDIQIDSELNFIYRRNGVIREYSQLSHGQHVYIALSFKRGMSNVIQKRIGIPIKLLELDEVDANLDESGIEAFADAIQKWKKDYTIFVITHNKDLKDKFSHAILVEEEQDGATATLVTSW